MYTAPELFNGTGLKSDKCDVWSVGVIIYILLSGQPPFAGGSLKTLEANILRGHFDIEGVTWKHHSKEAKDLLRSMLVVKFSERATAEHALKSAWLTMNRHSLKEYDLGPSLANLYNFNAGSKLKQAVLGFFMQNLLS
jgi:serine/threonine protein kinase